MKTADIRKTFLEYFAGRGHEVVASSSLVPGNDPTLLFTNSGMVQFKDVFLGDERRDYRRAVTSQRCVRAGGKHNDLENVGYTARHLTFFEMLGNFSFGDYFKEDAIQYAWELLTEQFGLPADKLWVTVFEEDDEAESIWIEQVGVPAERVARIGEKDNFWRMGDTGPCGPCSEIFYDHGPEVAGGPPGTPEEDGDRFIEIWNLVFMQFNRDADGGLTPLPKPSVDTGMGLERMAAVMQGVHSNYDIDLFRNLIEAAAGVVGIDDRSSKSLRVIADHIRSASFLVSDGVIPSNEGRGYVLRRIIRRAIRHGYQAGCREPFMHRLAPPLVAEMGEAFPELVSNEKKVTDVLRQENENFNETLEQGLKLLDREIGELKGDTLSGDTVFRLYDTYGFPADLTADVAREQGLQIDHQGFEAAMAEQRRRARSASRFDGGETLRVDGVTATEFTGYADLEESVEVTALLRDGEPVEVLESGQAGVVVLSRSPFYAESGGQTGDRGRLELGGGQFVVDDTRYLADKVIGHFGEAEGGAIRLGDSGRARVDGERRVCNANHHSATHLVHAALKRVLGDHVEQKGSLVEPSRLRFDFSHYEPVSGEQVARIEKLVNRQVRANHEVGVEVMDLDAAKAAGAEALFGEKYDARVRVVRMGDFSFELCGGTHVARTGDIGLFKIISETGVAAGVRRIEAVCGEAAESLVERQAGLVADLARLLKTSDERLAERVSALVETQKQQEKQIQSLQARLASGAADTDAVQEVGGVKMVSLRQDDTDVKAMRMAVDQWRERLKSGVVFIAGVADGKVVMIAGVSKDLGGKFPAGELVAELAPRVGGRGGGKPVLAQGGGPDTGAIDGLIEAAREWVASRA